MRSGGRSGRIRAHLKLRQLGLAILRNLETYHLREMRKLKAKLKINPDAKSWERFKDKVQTSRLILDSHKPFKANLDEFLTALDAPARFATLVYRHLLW
jgi:hypothetical protein